jgi:hypothetical protein
MNIKLSMDEDNEFEVELEEDSENWNPEEELDKIWEEQKTEWFSVDIKPEHKGEYEIELESTTWPFPLQQRATWSGRIWKDSDGVKISNIKQWRGLNFDPNEIEFKEDV